MFVKNQCFLSVCHTPLKSDPKRGFPFARKTKIFTALIFDKSINNSECEK